MSNDDKPRWYVRARIPLGVNGEMELYSDGEAIHCLVDGVEHLELIETGVEEIPLWHTFEMGTGGFFIDGKKVGG